MCFFAWNYFFPWRFLEVSVVFLLLHVFVVVVLCCCVYNMNFQHVSVQICPSLSTYVCRSVGQSVGRSVSQPATRTLCATNENKAKKICKHLGMDDLITETQVSTKSESVFVFGDSCGMCMDDFPQQNRKRSFVFFHQVQFFCLRFYFRFANFWQP